MADAGLKIALCICTYDRYDLLPKAIESAAGQTLPAAAYEIIVIDNSPNHERAALFGQKFSSIPNLRYIVEKTPGLSNARNLAAHETKAPIIAFMDDDAIAAPNWAAELLNAYAAFGPSAMIVGGRVDPIWSEPRPAWLPDEKLGNLSVVNWGGEARIAEPREWVAGTNISFRVEAILQYGGFARNLGRIGSGAPLLSNEETHLVEKIRAAGGLLIYAPEASVRHLVDERRLSPTWFIKRSAWQAISDFMMSPDTQVAQAENRWRNVTHYFNRLPPHLRTVRGLMTENEDPEMFEAQMGAVYELTVLMLSGFEGVKLD